MDWLKHNGQKNSKGMDETPSMPLILTEKPRRVRIRRCERIEVIFRGDMRLAKNTYRGVSAGSEA